MSGRKKKEKIECRAFWLPMFYFPMSTNDYDHNGLGLTPLLLVRPQFLKKCSYS